MNRSPRDPPEPGRKQALIACDVFSDEIAFLCGKWGISVQTIFLEMGLHDRPDRLRAEIQQAVHALEGEGGVDSIGLAYGLCGGGLAGVRARHLPLVLPRAHDCVAVMLGGMEAYSSATRDRPATYFYSPGWVRGRRVPGPDREDHLRAFYSRRYPDNPERVEALLEADRETFRMYHRAGYIDLAGNPGAENYTRRCADCLGWSFRQLTADPALLADLLRGHWDPERFLLVPPGQEVVQSLSDRVMEAQPTPYDS